MAHLPSFRFPYVKDADDFLDRWPVIAVIVIGGLIIISVIWCLARCLCCGLSCCCECCYCLRCCGNCCGCCDTPKGGRRKHLDEPYRNIPDDKGYQPHDPMSTGDLPWTRPTTAAKPEPPQYASFDVSKKPQDEDSLPAMPTWGDADSKKVEVEAQAEAEAVELQQLKKPDVVNGPNAPLMNGMSPAGTPGPGTPVQNASPYGAPGAMNASSGYLGAAGAPAANGYNSMNNMSGQGGYGQMHNAYGQSTTSFHTEQSWGVTGAPVGQDYGQAHSQVGYGQNGWAQEPEGYGAQPGYDQYANSSAPTGINQPYGRAPPTRSLTGSSGASMVGGGAAYPDRSRGSPAPSQGQFPSDRSFDPRIAPQRTYSPAPMQQGQFPGGAPQRTYSPAPQGPPRTFSPAPGAPPRHFSPAPGARSSPGPQRGWSADTAPGRGPAPRGPPHRQFSTDSAQTAPPPRRQFSNDSPRPMGGGNRPPHLANGRAPPQRQYTADVPAAPRSPNFSRPTRSNTYDEAYAPAGGQEEQPAAYPGYKPYQPTR